MERLVSAEWEEVKNVPSLYQHYGSAKEYAKWRHRLLKAGYLHKSDRTWKRHPNPKEHRLAYQREYYKQWRGRNGSKAKEHVYNYWKRRFLSEMEVRLKHTG